MSKTTTVTNLLGKAIEVEAGDWVVVPGEGSDTDWGRVVVDSDGDLAVAWEGGANRTPLPTVGVEGVYTSRSAAEEAFGAHVAALQAVADEEQLKEEAKKANDEELDREVAYWSKMERSIEVELDSVVGPRVLVTGEHDEAEIEAALPKGWTVGENYDHGVKLASGAWSYPLVRDEDVAIHEV